MISGPSQFKYLTVALAAFVAAGVKSPGTCETSSAGTDRKLARRHARGQRTFLGPANQILSSSI